MKRHNKTKTVFILGVFALAAFGLMNLWKLSFVQETKVKTEKIVKVVSKIVNE
jgi:hypothetical protein